MSEGILSQPAFIGRKEEHGRLKHSLDSAISGKGSTVFIAGEAGIGKTRLVSELIKHADSGDCRTIRGWCLAESLEPLMPVREMLRGAGLQHLISDAPPPRVIAAYLINNAGMLIAKAESEGLGIDSDIFAGMLQAVGNFVKDSLSMMDRGTAGGLSSLGYADHTILIRSSGKLSLATVIEGKESEFLIDDMVRVLAEFGDAFDSWKGSMASAESAIPKMTWFVESGKYDGKFLVDDPKIRQENLFDNVLLGLQRASAEKPLLVFLDDLHWADPTTLNLLHYLARNTRSSRVLILGTYRPEDITQGLDGRPHQLETAMQNMSREGLFEKIGLKRLDRGPTETLINSVLGPTRFEPGFYDKIHRETEGTPFFVLEVVKLLAEEGAIAQDETGAWVLVKELENLDMPSKVYDVIKRRLDRLLREQREMLECASVIGEEFTTGVLEKTSGMRKLALLKNLSEIEKVHRLLHYLKDRYRFDHAKIREVLYGGIGEELRREYHRMVGDTIAELHRERPEEVMGELAYHYHEAGDRRAGSYLIMAGDRAREKFANEEAVRLYGNALEFVDEAEKVHVLEKLGEVHGINGEYESSIEVFRAAKDIADDRETEARMLRKLGDAYVKISDFDLSLEILAEAKGLAEAGTAEYGRILISIGYPYLKKGDNEMAMPLFLEAIEIAENVGADKKDIGDAFRAVGICHWNKGEYEEALRYYEKSLAMMEEIGEQYGIAAALGNIGNVYNLKGELDRALDYYGRSLEIFEKIGGKLFVAVLMGNIGSVHNLKGDLDKALEYYERSLNIKEKIGDKQGIAISMGNIGNLCGDKGESERALEYYLGSLEIYEKIGDKQGVAMSQSNIGVFHTERGELDRALEYYEKSLAISLEVGDKLWTLRALSNSAEVILEKGNVKNALERAEKALGISIEIGAKAEEGKSLRALGMVHRGTGDWDRAAEEFGRAARILEDIGEKNELARLSYEQGLLSRAMGDPAKSRRHLEKALAEFEGMGMKLWAGKCRKELEGTI